MHHNFVNYITHTHLQPAYFTFCIVVMQFAARTACIRARTTATGRTLATGHATANVGSAAHARAASTIIQCRTVEDMRAARQQMDADMFRKHGRPARVGFVPTMGALHAGHLQLLDAARAGAGDGPADYVVSSVFVNPTQFAPHEDLSKYPRTWDADLAALKAKACDAVLVPTASAMYPPSAPYRTFISQTDVDANTPEGLARPGFFRGVATVVTKLLNIVNPTHAVFGQKDGIQCIVVRTLARDLNIPTKIVVAPTMRDPDGLAMSSRNVYLSPEQRAAAPAIYAALTAAQGTFAASPEARASAAARATGATAQLTAAEAEQRAQQAAVAHSKGNGSNETLQLCSTFSHIVQQVEHTIRTQVRPSPFCLLTLALSC